MKKKMKIIDIFCLINCNKQVPRDIMYKESLFSFDNTDKDYYNENYGYLFEYLVNEHRIDYILDMEVEILDEEDEKDIPLIPDDGLYEFNMKDKPLDLDNLNYNFKVLEEKINQVVEEFNEYRKEVKENE